jgi:hypothetical protein
MLGVVVVGVYL